MEDITPSKRFDKLYSIYVELNDSITLTTEQRRDKLKEAILLAEHLVNKDLEQLRLFSSNDHYDEIASKDLRMLLVFALRGHFVNEQPFSWTNNKLGMRRSIVSEALLHYAMFLNKCISLAIFETKNCPLSKSTMESLQERCNVAIMDESDDPGISADDSNNDNNFEPQTDKSRRQFDVISAARSRRAKINKFKRMKEQANGIRQLSEACRTHSENENRSNEQGSLLQPVHSSDNCERDLCILQIHYWLNKVEDEVDSLCQELKYLKSRLKNLTNAVNDDPSLPDFIDRSDEMTGQSKNHSPFEQKQHLGSKGLPNAFTLISNRYDLKGSVLGAGYPSLPTLSIEEFYDSLRQRGILRSCHYNIDQRRSTVSTDIDGGSDGQARPVINQWNTKADDELAAEQADEDEDREADEKLRQQRIRFDEYKDTHFKGAGNRYKRS